MAGGNPTVIFPEPRKVVIEDREIPRPGPGELLLRTRATLISTGTELTILSGEFPPGGGWAEWAQYPFTPGYSNVGEVVEVGPGVDANWIGRRLGNWGNHTQYVVVPADEASPYLRIIHREEVSSAEAAFATIGEITMNGVRRAGVAWGESVVVFGLGLLGQLVVRHCRLCGARPVFAVDVAESRLKLVPDDPAIVKLNPRQQSVADVVEAVTRGRKADVVFEVTGNASLIPGEFAPLRRQGRFVVLSSPRESTSFDFNDLCNAPSYTILGVHNASHPKHGELDLPWTGKRHAELFYDLIADREIDVAGLISHRAPYTEAPQLFQMLLEDRSQAMGVVLEWPE